VLKQLWRDSVAYSIGRVLTAVLGIFLLPLYTAHLAPNQYGLYDMGNAIISIAMLIVALEIAQGAARYYCEDEDPRRRREYFSTALFFTLGAFALLWAVALLSAPHLTESLLGPDARPDTLLLVAGAATAGAAFRLGQAQLRWMLRPRAFLACTLLQVVLGAAIATALVVHWDSGAHGLIWGLVGGNGAGFLLALWLGRRGIGLSWSSVRLREMLAFSLPLVASSGAVWVALYIDRLAIKELMTMADVGRYGVAYRFAAAIEIVMFGFDKAFIPLLYANYRDPNTPPALAKLLRILVVVGGAILLALAAASHELLHVLVDPAYRDGAQLIPVLATSVLLTRLGNLGPGLWIANRTGLIAWINVGVAIMNLLLNLLLIPVLGVMGSALATATSALIGFVVNMRASQRLYPSPHAWRRVVLGSVAIATGIAALLWLGARWPPLSGLGMALKVLTAASSLLLAAVAVLQGEEWAALGRFLRRLRA